MVIGKLDVSPIRYEEIATPKCPLYSFITEDSQGKWHSQEGLRPRLDTSSRQEVTDALTWPLPST